MAAYAALVSLMNNIEQIQRHTRLPISLDQVQMESLHEKVRFLIDFLEDYNSPTVSKEMKKLERQITNVAYETENIIETHVVDKIEYHFKPRKEDNKIMDHLRCILPQYKNKTVTTIFAGQAEENQTASRLPGIKKVLKVMKNIKKKAMKIKDRRGIDGSQTSSQVITHVSSSIHVENNAMVVFEHELTKLTDWLTGNESSRQIISIIGMGGIGKTTLAKTAYEKPFIGKHFDYCAWVSISQEYDLKKILLGLLRRESSPMSDNELGLELHKTLYGRRYLMVLDDMWNVRAWEMVQAFLPDNSNGSRIIVTTRISSLATCFGSSNIEMNLLDEDKGWNLLCEKVFGQEGCSRELEKVGRKIVNKCQGLPLLIVVIGGLLAKSERTTKYWEYIERDTSATERLEGDEMCMKILYLSYNNLPIHLKPCFLYMGVFPEDEVISVRLLLKLWVAEGFLKPNSSKELEVVATEYLNELISRNLILVLARGLNGKIKSCMIHDILRNLCLKEAREGKFMYVPKMHSQDKARSISRQRRISIPTSLHIPKHLHIGKLRFSSRSLICPTALSLQNFRLLRVLKGCDESIYDAAIYLLDDTLNLVNSRFIVIKTIERPEISPSIGLLWNLKILIVLGIQKGPIAPLEIWEMTELRHLQFSWSLRLPDPPSEPMNRRRDAVMKKLHTLKRVEDFRFNDEVVKRIPNIKKLVICYGLTRKELEEHGLKNLGLLKNLESLTLSFSLQTGSDLLSYLILPDSLKKLSLQNCGLRWLDMSMIGSLPHLEVLKLNSDAFVGHKWELSEDGFLSLKYLVIYYCRNLVQWIADDTSFPHLEHLRLTGLDKLEKIPSGIGDIPTLRMIELYNCSKSAIFSATEIFKEQESYGNKDLQVRISCKMDDVPESLASDNFQITTWTM